MCIDVKSYICIVHTKCIHNKSGLDDWLRRWMICIYVYVCVYNFLSSLLLGYCTIWLLIVDYCCKDNLQIHIFFVKGCIGSNKIKLRLWCYITACALLIFNNLRVTKYWKYTWNYNIIILYVIPLLHCFFMIWKMKLESSVIRK